MGIHSGYYRFGGAAGGGGGGGTALPDTYLPRDGNTSQGLAINLSRAGGDQSWRFRRQARVTSGDRAAMPLDGVGDAGQINIQPPAGLYDDLHYADANGIVLRVRRVQHAVAAVQPVATLDGATSGASLAWTAAAALAPTPANPTYNLVLRRVQHAVAAVDAVGASVTLDGATSGNSIRFGFDTSGAGLPSAQHQNLYHLRVSQVSGGNVSVSVEAVSSRIRLYVNSAHTLAEIKTAWDAAVSTHAFLADAVITGTTTDTLASDEYPANIGTTVYVETGFSGAVDAVAGQTQAPLALRTGLHGGNSAIIIDVASDHTLAEFKTFVVGQTINGHTITDGEIVITGATDSVFRAGSSQSDPLPPAIGQSRTNYWTGGVNGQTQAPLAWLPASGANAGLRFRLDVASDHTLTEIRNFLIGRPFTAPDGRSVNLAAADVVLSGSGSVTLESDEYPSTIGSTRDQTWSGGINRQPVQFATSAGSKVVELLYASTDTFTEIAAAAAANADIAAVLAGGTPGTSTPVAPPTSGYVDVPFGIDALPGSTAVTDTTQMGGGSTSFSDATPLGPSAAGSAGSGDIATREGHRHPLPTGTQIQTQLDAAIGTNWRTGGATTPLSDAVPQGPGTGGNAGVGTSASRDDHRHPLPSAAHVKFLYESNSNTNAFSDALRTKLNGIESGATADQSDAEIVAAINQALGNTTWQSGGGNNRVWFTSSTSILNSAADVDNVSPPTTFLADETGAAPTAPDIAVGDVVINTASGHIFYVDTVGAGSVDLTYAGQLSLGSGGGTTELRVGRAGTPGELQTARTGTNPFNIVGITAFFSTGTTTVRDLRGNSLSSVTDGDLLVWDSGDGNWERVISGAFTGNTNFRVVGITDASKFGSSNAPLVLVALNNITVPTSTVYTPGSGGTPLTAVTSGDMMLYEVRRSRWERVVAASSAGGSNVPNAPAAGSSQTDYNLRIATDGTATWAEDTGGGGGTGKADTDLQNIDTDLTATERATVRTRIGASVAEGEQTIADTAWSSDTQYNKSLLGQTGSVNVTAVIAAPPNTEVTKFQGAVETEVSSYSGSPPHGRFRAEFSGGTNSKWYPLDLLGDDKAHFNFDASASFTIRVQAATYGSRFNFRWRLVDQKWTEEGDLHDSTQALARQEATRIFGDTPSDVAGKADADITGITVEKTSGFTTLSDENPNEDFAVSIPQVLQDLAAEHGGDILATAKITYAAGNDPDTANSIRVGSTVVATREHQLSDLSREVTVRAILPAATTAFTVRAARNAAGADSVTVSKFDVAVTPLPVAAGGMVWRGLQSRQPTSEDTSRDEATVWLQAETDGTLTFWYSALHSNIFRQGDPGSGSGGSARFPWQSERNNAKPHRDTDSDHYSDFYSEDITQNDSRFAIGNGSWQAAGGTPYYNRIVGFMAALFWNTTSTANFIRANGIFDLYRNGVRIGSALVRNPRGTPATVTLGGVVFTAPEVDTLGVTLGSAWTTPGQVTLDAGTTTRIAVNGTAGSVPTSIVISAPNGTNALTPTRAELVATFNALSEADRHGIVASLATGDTGTSSITATSSTNMSGTPYNITSTEEERWYYSTEYTQDDAGHIGEAQLVDTNGTEVDYLDWSTGFVSAQWRDDGTNNTSNSAAVTDYGSVTVDFGRAGTGGESGLAGDVETQPSRASYAVNLYARPASGTTPASPATFTAIGWNGVAITNEPTNFPWSLSIPALGTSQTDATHPLWIASGRVEYRNGAWTFAGDWSVAQITGFDLSSVLQPILYSLSPAGDDPTSVMPTSGVYYFSLTLADGSRGPWTLAGYDPSRWDWQLMTRFSWIEVGLYDRAITPGIDLDSITEAYVHVKQLQSWDDNADIRFESDTPPISIDRIPVLDHGAVSAGAGDRMRCFADRRYSTFAMSRDHLTINDGIADASKQFGWAYAFHRSSGVTTGRIVKTVRIDSRAQPYPVDASLFVR